MLSRIFGPKRDEVTGSGEDYITRSLMICTAHQILFGRSNREERWAGHVARMGDRRGVYRVLVGKHEGKRPLGRPRRRCKGKGHPCTGTEALYRPSGP